LPLGLSDCNTGLGQFYELCFGLCFINSGCLALKKASYLCRKFRRGKAFGRGRRFQRGSHRYNCHHNNFFSDPGKLICFIPVLRGGFRHGNRAEKVSQNGKPETADDKVYRNEGNPLDFLVESDNNITKGVLFILPVLYFLLFFKQFP